MADWDPFEVTEAPLDKITTVKVDPGADKKGRANASDRAFLANVVYDMINKEAPWSKVTSAKPDLDWFTPFVKWDNWLHKDVKLEISDGIGYVIFNRPNENNTLNDTLGAGINDSLLALHERTDLRVAVFTAEGRMFCAGGDPKGWQAAALAAKGVILDGDGTVGHRLKHPGLTQEVYDHNAELTIKGVSSGLYTTGFESTRLHAALQWHMWTLVPQFSICLVNGSAMGGGCGIICMTDYVISVKKAFIVLSEVKIGVIPATISPYVISKMGTSNAKRLCCTAENMKAEKAQSVGIVDEVVDKMDQGHARIREICKLVSACGPKSVIAAKALSFSVSGLPMRESVMFHCAGRAHDGASSEEAKLGKAAADAKKPMPWLAQPIVPLY